MYRIVVISMFKIQDPTLPSSHIEKNILEEEKKRYQKKKKKNLHGNSWFWILYCPISVKNMFIITSIAQRHCVFHAGRWRRLAEVKRNETENVMCSCWNDENVIYCVNKVLKIWWFPCFRIKTPHCPLVDKAINCNIQLIKLHQIALILPVNNLKIWLATVLFFVFFAFLLLLFKMKNYRKNTEKILKYSGKVSGNFPIFMCWEE